ALGFYLSLGSASLLLEGGIATYVEEGKKNPVSERALDPIVVVRSCPACGKDLSQFLPSLPECPFCGRLLSTRKEGLEEREVLVFKK
ncbi:MAG: hypothetical protein QXF24_05275, partial [Thermoproteota archaeon]